MFRLRVASGLALSLALMLGLLPTHLSAQPTSQPNVLIILTDDQRWDAMETLPKVTEWFTEQGATFTNAYATTPLCCPSRASIFTGRYTHNHHVDANAGHAVRNLDPKTLLTYYLKKAGYTTGIFGKYFNPWPLDKKPHYFDRWAVTNFNYYNAKFNVQGRPQVIKRYSTDYISDKSVNFVKDAVASDRPWFLYVAPVAPHGPYVPKRKYANAPVSSWGGNPAVGENTSDKPQWVGEQNISPQEGKKIRTAQLRTLLSVNDLVGRLMRNLEELGEADETIAVYMSDNGYFWGEHGLTDKRLPYLQSIKIPLILRWPDQVEAGSTDARIAANLDVPATVLDAVGIDPEHTIDGRSLLEEWQRDRLLLEYERDDPPFDVIPPWAGLITNDYEYVEYYRDQGGRLGREYYDLIEDPWQLTNLLGDADASNDPSSETLQNISNQLQSDRVCRGSACP